MGTWMKSLGALLPLLRYICAVSPDSTDDPIISAELAVGGGSFAVVSRDCDGNVHSVKDYPYQEVAGKVSAEFSGLKIAMAAGRTNGQLEYEGSSQYVNGEAWEYRAIEVQPTLMYATPSVGIETAPIGLEVGILYSLNGQNIGWTGDGASRTMFSGGLRLGRKDKFHFSAGCARNMPLLAGGGLFDAGFSYPVSDGPSSVWLGLGGAPYDGLVFSIKGDVILNKHLALTPRLSFKGGDAFEYGYAIGVRARF